VQRTVHETISHAELLLPGSPAPDGQPDARWQAIFDVSEFIDKNPDEVLAFTLRWGSHANEDVRAAISCCLLEHLLERHFLKVFPKIEATVRSDALFAETFRLCFKLGQAGLPENAARFERLRSECEVERSGR
jgi:hypothetical protein